MSLAMFYALVAVLILLCFIAPVIPWLVKRNDKETDLVTNIQLTKARIQEMHSEVDEGVLGEEERIQAENEIKLALVDDHTDVTLKSKTKTYNAIGLVAGAVIVIVSGLIVYFQVNHIDGLKALSSAPENLQSLSAKLLDPQLSQSVSPNDINALALAIRLRLREQPDDAQGWMFLGRLRMTINQLEEAVAAYERSLALRPDNTMTRVSYAQALMMSNSDTNLNKAQRELSLLLEGNPENDNLNLMMAVATAQLGQNERAAVYYLKVREKLAINNPMRQSLDNQLGLRTVQNDTNSDIKVSDNVFSNTLSLTISVSESIKNYVSEYEHMVVFIRPNEQQSGMPIAVKRIQEPSLPMTLLLGDSDAMMPTDVLSNYESVNVTVRLSKTPDVAARADDLQGQLFISQRDANQEFEIIINKAL